MTPGLPLMKSVLMLLGKSVLSTFGLSARIAATDFDHFKQRNKRRYENS